MNIVYLIGRLTKDPDVYWVNEATGNKVAKFTLALNKTLERDKTNYIPCIAWSKNATFAEKYLRKGTRILIYGELEQSVYTNKNGIRINALEVRVIRFEFIDSKATSVSTQEKDAMFVPEAPEAAPSNNSKKEAKHAQIPMQFMETPTLEEPGIDEVPFT